MEYKFKDVILKPRVTNWIKYRIPSIEFKDKYKKFKEQYVNPEVEKEIQEKIMGNKELMKLSIEKDTVGVSVILANEYPELFLKYSLQMLNENEIIEKYLIDNDLENLKLLFEIMFDNSSEIDYNITEEEYKLIFTIFDDFFSPLQKKKG